jgi:hypothetical protein
MSKHIANLLLVLQDTYRVEQGVVNRFSVFEAYQFAGRIRECAIPNAEVPSRRAYQNLLTEVASGIPISWRPDLETIRNFRSEVTAYQERLKNQIRQRSSQDRLSHIHLTEE